MVLADGTFDPVHCGHVAYLKAAREYGRPLMVRVAPDDDIFEKGRVPFQDLAERLYTLLSLKPVEGVCASATLAEAILEYRPSHLVKGIDWQGRLPDSVLAACIQTGTQVVFVDTQTRSSSERLQS